MQAAFNVPEHCEKNEFVYKNHNLQPHRHGSDFLQAYHMRTDDACEPSSTAVGSVCFRYT